VLAGQGVAGGHRRGAELRVGVAGLRGLLGCFGGPGRRPLAEFQARDPRRLDPTATRALTSTPTPAIQWMCQNPATAPMKAKAWAVALATATTRKLVLRRRNVSYRLTSTNAARSGIAIAKATAQIAPEMSREAPATNGCTRTMPIAINPP
jgi:hypothetical protein